MAVRYDPATHDSRGPAPGLVALVDHWRRTTGLGSLGIYNYRPVRGGASLSLHAEGRAADLACNAHDPNQRATGDRYADWLIAHSDDLQVQYLIWNRRSWKSGRGWRQYNGASPHTDHLHVEMNRDGAARPHPLLAGTATLTEEDAMTPEQEAHFASELQQIKHAVMRGTYGKPDHRTVYDDMIIRTGDAANALNVIRAHVVAIGAAVNKLDLDVEVDVDAGQVADELLEVLPDAVVDRLAARLKA